MPKLIIKAHPSVDLPVLIFLEDAGEEGVSIKSLRDGEEQYLLDIRNTGEVFLHTGINGALGFKLDKVGRLTLAKS